MTAIKNNLKYIFFFVLLAGIFSFSWKSSEGQLQSDPQQAKEAFMYLNSIRARPAAFSRDIHVNLSHVKPRPELYWNDTLAKVAEERARDMAERGYFAHVNPDGVAANYLISKSGYSLKTEWLESKKNNFFESIQAGASDSREAINDLIVDEGIRTLGHRKHLLGMDDWNASLKDIGIAFVYATGAKFQSYTVIIIAKHN